MMVNMKENTALKRKKIVRKIHFYFVRLPLIFILAPIGFVMEFIVTFPWRVAVAIDSCRQKTNK
jgi:hypothetical protein